MNRARATAAVVGSLLALAVDHANGSAIGGAGRRPAAEARSAALANERPAGPERLERLQQGAERYHYTMAARIRPLLLFWISRSGVGDAVVTRRRAPGETDYSLLIGSDPERAPRRINRWGYLGEEVRGSEARLIGLMTASDEESIEEAEANVRKQAHGDRTFKIIQATVDAQQARSVVTSIAAPEDYSFRQLGTLLELARREAPEGKARVVQLPPGTRSGFLSGLADAIHQQAMGLSPSAAVKYVYHGRIYELKATHAHMMPTLRTENATYDHVAASDFEIRSTYDGEVTRFSMTFGTQGTFAEVPLTASYQPRWWMQVDLALLPPDAAASEIFVPETRRNP
jgi:hypothetical protein